MMLPVLYYINYQNNVEKRSPQSVRASLILFFVSFFKIFANLGIHFFINLKFLLIKEEPNKNADKRKNHH